METFKYFKVVFLIISIIILNTLTGCTAIDKAYNIFLNLKPTTVEESVDNINTPGTLLSQQEYNNLSDINIDDVEKKLHELLKTDMSSNESLDSFRTLFTEFLVLLKDNPNSLTYAINMDKAIKSSNLYSRDLDKDYIPDLIEMTVTRTAPLLNKSQDNLNSSENKLDGKCNFTIKNLLVNTDTGIVTISPAFSSVISDNISSGVVQPKSNQWVSIESKVYGEDIASYILEVVNPNIPKEVGVQSIYPISYMTSGYNGAVLTKVEYHYNNNTGAGLGILVSQDIEKGTVNTDDYLFRTNTMTTSDGKITPNTIYSLIYPKVNK